MVQDSSSRRLQASDRGEGLLLRFVIVHFTKLTGILSHFKFHDGACCMQSHPILPVAKHELLILLPDNGIL
jgi:hypothetical protein